MMRLQALSKCIIVGFFIILESRAFLLHHELKKSTGVMGVLEVTQRMTFPSENEGKLLFFFSMVK